MNAANMLSTSRTKSALLPNQTTNQTLQPKPLIKSEALDQTEKMNFSELQLPYKEIFQEQHYFEPNHPCARFVRELKLDSDRDEQLSSKGVLPYNEPMYSKTNEDSDKRDHTSQQFGPHNIPIWVKSYSRQLFSPHVQNTKLMNKNMVQRTVSEDAAEHHVSSNWHFPGGTIDVKLVTAETFDDQPPVSKRLRLQPMPPNVSDSAYISFPQACPDFVSQQAQPKHLGQDKRIYPKQKLNTETDMQPLPKLEITRPGTVQKIGAVETYAIPAVSDHLDSHVEQQNCLANKDTNEGVIDIKMNASGSTDVLLSKTGKKKRKGISLLESLTLEQIYEHAHSTIQWVGQV